MADKIRHFMDCMHKINQALKKLSKETIFICLVSYPMLQKLYSVSWVQVNVFRPLQTIYG